MMKLYCYGNNYDDDDDDDDKKQYITRLQLVQQQEVL